MPTGYTYPIVEKGIGFKEFAMSCARAFGACVEMRDDPMDAPIPEKFEPSDYSTKRLAEAKAEVSRLFAMDTAQRDEFGRAKIEETIRMFQGLIEKRKLETQRLEAVEKDVLAWTPPSDEHKGLKEFMLEQIRTSKDADPDYWEREIEKLKQADPKQKWLESFNQATRDVEYHAEAVEKDRQRAESRTQWIQQLRASLK